MAELKLMGGVVDKLRHLWLVTIFICTVGCTTVPGRKNHNTSFPVIDTHTHTHFDGQPEMTSQIPNTKAQFLKELKEAGVVAAVSHSDNENWQIEDLSAHNVIHCAGIKPRFSTRDLEVALKSKKFKCIKIYLGYEHQYAYDKNYEPAYRLAEKYDVPVVFHTGDTYSSEAKLKYTDPLTIDEVAVDHPKVRFVIAHCGNPWIQSAAEVAYKNPNVYLECSAFLIGDLSQYSQKHLEKFFIGPLSYIFDYVENPEKVMFGTDWPLVSIKDYLEVYKKAIPREHWQAVFHDNAVKVFKLQR